MKIKIGTHTFSATLVDNPTANKFKSLLPMTVEMIDLNSNEKYADIPGNLSTQPTNPRKIEEGDIMIYGANTLVLFYKSFPTPYSYTTLGRIRNTTGLAAALGEGKIAVTFELE